MLRRGWVVVADGAVVAALVLGAVVAAAPAAGGAARTDRSSDLQQQILEAGTQETAALKQLQSLEAAKAPIDAKVADLDAQLSQANAQLADLQAQATQLATEAADLQAELVTQQGEFDAAHGEFEGTAAQLYRSVRRGISYDYISASQPEELVQTNKYLHLVEYHRHRELQHLNTLRIQIIDKRSELQTNQAKLEQAATDAKAISDSIQVLRDEIEPVRAKAQAAADAEQRQVDLIRAAKVSYEREYASLQATSDSIGALLRARGTAGTAPSPPCAVRPVSAPVVSGYGPRVDPISGAAGFHPGDDLGASLGTPIKACYGGTVVIASWQGGYGNAVVIDHGGGVATLYGHQSQLAVSVGQHVNAGQTIGYVGSTGYSTGPHLHFEVRISGNTIDPINYL